MQRDMGELIGVTYDIDRADFGILDLESFTCERARLANWRQFVSVRSRIAATHERVQRKEPGPRKRCRPAARIDGEPGEAAARGDKGTADVTHKMRVERSPVSMAPGTVA